MMSDDCWTDCGRRCRPSLLPETLIGGVWNLSLKSRFTTPQSTCILIQQSASLLSPVIQRSSGWRHGLHEHLIASLSSRLGLWVWARWDGEWGGQMPWSVRCQLSTSALSTDCSDRANADTLC